MNNSRRSIKIILALLLASLLLAACAPASPTGPVTMKLALLPILDALPIHVAQSAGYFEEEGLQVEFVPVTSAAERDQIMAAGQADGMINDLVSTLFYNKDQTQIQIVSFSRTATPEFPQYRILASGESGITTLDQLKNVPIGISEGSVIAYTTDRLLQAEGFTAEEIQTLAVPKIPDRLALLESGELQAANLPDPFGSLAIQGGAVPIIDDTAHPEYGNSVLSFRKAFIDEHPEAVSGFLKALDRAIQDINADPAQFEDLLVEQKLIPAPLIGVYQMPPFPRSQVPTQAQWDDVNAWVMEKGLAEQPVSYDSSVTSEFLP